MSNIKYVVEGVNFKAETSVFTDNLVISPSLQAAINVFNILAHPNIDVPDNFDIFFNKENEDAEIGFTVKVYREDTPDTIHIINSIDVATSANIPGMMNHFKYYSQQILK